VKEIKSSSSHWQMEVSTGSIVVTFLILLFGLLFYWFQVRPEQKLNECIKSANESSSALWKTWDDNGDGKLESVKANKVMELNKEAKDRCIRRWK
jgi:hypothetical protein